MLPGGEEKKNEGKLEKLNTVIQESDRATLMLTQSSEDWLVGVVYWRAEMVQIYWVQSTV